VTRIVFIAALLIALVPAAAWSFTVSGRFFYEDRIYNGLGYTGAVQNLPIRRARVDIVHVLTQQTLGTGYTDATGRYSIAVTGQTLPLGFFARCRTDGRPAYQTWVVDAANRDLMGGWVPPNAPVHAITTDPRLAHAPSQDHDFGDFVIQDEDGTGVAQAFNIFDCAVDMFDWISQPGLLGRLPNVSEYLTFSWGPANPNEGSNYSVNTILLASPGQGNDTDGWSDTVILHEAGHWFDDVFSKTDNPGGEHFIGDNNANVLLAYGEGVATFHCAKVREHRAVARGVDDLVSLYADLQIPPPVGTSGGLSFSYDFEEGNFADDGSAIGQRGTANETNVTSALWDLLDGPSTPDFSAGSDDDMVEITDDYAWRIEHDYLVSMGNPITVEDYYQGWFVLNGAGFMQAGMDQIFVTRAKMPFFSDAFESNNTLATATEIGPVPYQLAAGRVVINELELGATDAVELYNGSPNLIDLTNWRIEVFANGLAPEESLNVYVFTQPRTLGPGETVTLHEAGDPLADGLYHVYGGDRAVFNASWNPGVDGAALLRDDAGTPIDFVKWRDADGVNNRTPVPAGLSFSGTLNSPPAPFTLARSIHGTDTDAASDFLAHYGSLGSVNNRQPQAHTVFNLGDQDLLRFTAEANTRYGFEARSSFSASDAHLELLSSSGAVLGSNNNVDPSVRDARLDFFASSAGTYYLRVTHVGPNTDWAEYDLLAFIRPVNNIFLPPSGLTATAENESDAGDAVLLQWVNASLYDSVRIYRNGARIAVTAGNSGEYTDHANRGLHHYEVAGLQAGTETGRAGDFEFAGVVTCFASDDFEAGNANLWIRPESGPGSRWDVTTLAEAGLFGFTDSPAGTYRGATGGGNVNAIAEFAVPARLRRGARLEWDQICITEEAFDFCIVEISSDDGVTWTELARYDQSADPRWEDFVAEPGDWRHESIDLSDYVNQLVLVRFRLQSDQLLELDGWYVDNVLVGNSACELVAADIVSLPDRLELLPPQPNPMRGSARFAFVLPRAEEQVELAIYDVGGRVIRHEQLGALEAGLHAWNWNGRDGEGRSIPSGAYFARLVAGGEVRRQKLLKLAP